MDTLETEFDERLRDSGTLAYRVAYSVLRQRQDAEDVAQEAFVRAHREFGALRDRERFRAWLVRTTWRLAIDRWRQQRRRAAREQAVDEPIDTRTGEDVTITRERAARVWRAIDDLPDKLRVVIVLCAIEGHDLREVAHLLEIPEGTVKSRLFLARKALAETLQCLKNT
ncbi:MAG TPA: RNA polymerase sigma factor [Vicinamibacterales bacterium]